MIQILSMCRRSGAFEVVNDDLDNHAGRRISENTKWTMMKATRFEEEESPIERCQQRAIGMYLRYGFTNENEGSYSRSTLLEVPSPH